MVHHNKISSYRSIDWIGFWSLLGLAVYLPSASAIFDLHSAMLHLKISVTFFTLPVSELSLEGLAIDPTTVLWHCWLGHLACKIVPKMIMSSGTLNPTCYRRLWSDAVTATTVTVAMLPCRATVRWWTHRSVAETDSCPDSPASQCHTRRRSATTPRSAVSRRDNRHKLVYVEGCDGCVVWPWVHAVRASKLIELWRPDSTGRPSTETWVETRQRMERRQRLAEDVLNFPTIAVFWTSRPTTTTTWEDR